MTYVLGKDQQKEDTNQKKMSRRQEDWYTYVYVFPILYN
jgi:hypothetical protein